jgi:hypothetical protein
MANEALRNLTTGTLAADSAVPIQNTSAATRMQQASFSEMGGLVLASNSLTTANLTASVGTLHQLTIAGLTAIRDFILPDTAAVGERVALYIVDGDPTYEVNIKTAATGSLLNGVDHSATAWSKVFIQHETMVFRCINAGGAGDTDWIVEHDGRIPCVARMHLATDAVAFLATANTSYQIEISTVDNDSFGGTDTGNYHILVRRGGNYGLSAKFACTTLGADFENIETMIYVNNGATKVSASALKQSGTGGYQAPQAFSLTAPLSSGDTLELWGKSSSTSNRTVRGHTAWTFLEMSEILER